MTRERVARARGARRAGARAAGRTPLAREPDETLTLGAYYGRARESLAHGLATRREFSISYISRFEPERHRTVLYTRVKPYMY